MRYDLLWHFFIMFGITLIPIKKSRFVWGWLFLLPAVVEAIQLFIPTRTADWLDLQVGIGGVICGYCLIRLYRETVPTFRKYIRMKKRTRRLK